MRSLVIATALPLPANSGDAMRTWQNAVSLTHTGPVGVFGLRVDEPSRPPHPGIELWTSSRDPSLTDPATASSLDWLREPGGMPWDQYFSSRALAELDDVIARFAPDVVVVEALWLSRYLEPLARRDFRVILDLPNVYSTFYRELVHRSSPAAAIVRHELAERSEVIERAAFGLVDQIWVCSAADAELVRPRVGATPLEIVPNTIDVESYPYDRWSARSQTMTFPAMFGYSPNETAALLLAREIVPRLAPRFDDLRLVLVGRNPTPPMLEAASTDPRVVVTGAVADVRPYLAESGVVPMPLFDGSGTRLKALEAFAAGVPVVSTAKGVEGLAASPETHYLRAEDVDQFVDAVHRLWLDPAMAVRLAKQARALVANRYSWDVARERIGAALDRVTP